MLCERGPDAIVLRASSEGAHVIAFRGSPIDEPIVRDEPFVMTEPDAIRRAYADYKSGRLGTA